jgi:hypothetical protein
VREISQANFVRVKPELAGLEKFSTVKPYGQLRVSVHTTLLNIWFRFMTNKI